MVDENLLGIRVEAFNLQIFEKGVKFLKFLHEPNISSVNLVKL